MRKGLAKVDGSTNLMASDLSMVQSCLGILADLKSEGKGFNMQSNPNLLGLAALTGEDS